MAILKGIKFKDSDEVHQLDYETGIGNKPTLVESFNDLKDLPFYTEGETVEVLPQSDYAFAVMEGVYATQLASGYIPFEADKTYNIEWDGTLYSCVSLGEITEGNTEIYVGNITLLGEGNDTGEPFLMLYWKNEDAEILTIGANSEETSHNIRVWCSDEIVHQLDAKYVNAFTKQEMGIILGLYVDEVNTLLGGED